METAEIVACSLNPAVATAGKVLIVEDEKELAEVLEYNLRREGYAVLTAHDGLSACRLIGTERPDLILLDILLPDLDGWEICRLIRGHHEAAVASTPIIMLTALGALDDRLKGLELGADAYLAKPYALREVMLRVRQLLAKRREWAALSAEKTTLRAGAAMQVDLLDMLFHELRNQLVVIGGYSALLAKGVHPVSAGEYMQAIHRSTEHLSSLAEGFLLARRLEEGKLALPLEPVDPNALLVNVAAMLHPLAAEKRIGIRVETDLQIPQLPLNRAAMSLVLSSLLENAIKFSGPRTEIFLRLRRVPDGCVTVEVEDLGPGIPAAEIDHVFDRFYRGEHSASKTEGSGLGLYICRTLTRAMSGSIGVTSAPGEGSRFEVRLPIPAAAGVGA